MMNCNDARPLLDPLSDGALEAKDCALVLDHLKSCKDCQSEWNDIEQLQTRFKNAREKTQLTPDFMDKISEALEAAETADNQRSLKSLVKPIPMMAIAATILIVGFLLFPSLQHQPDTSTTVASADALVEELALNKLNEPVADRDELSKKLGYELKFLHLPAWKMDKASLLKTKRSGIARFDFVATNPADTKRLSCYQAPLGTIHADGGAAKTVGTKQVKFGNHGDLQYAFWSQDGRDYLFVTALPQNQLEEIVRGA